MVNMRILLNLLAVLIILTGVVWFLQGINIIPGSFMTGQSQWAVYGGIAIVAWVLILAFANRKRATSPKK
jgi:hypothetical protein